MLCKSNYLEFNIASRVLLHGVRTPLFTYIIIMMMIMRIIIDSKFGSLLKFRTQMLTYIITMIMCLCVITSQLHGVACVTMIPRLLLSALHYCFLHFPLHCGKPITECNIGSAEKFYPDSKLVQKFRYVTFCF